MTPRYVATPGGKREAKKVLAKLSSEHAQQSLLIAWARTLESAYPELTYLFAIPNGAKLPYRKDRNGNRYSPEANKLLAEGLRSGVSDLFLAVPKSPYHGLFIEMKWGSNTTSVEQAAFLHAVEHVGYRTAVCYSFEAARETIVTYLGLPSHLLE